MWRIFTRLLLATFGFVAVSAQAVTIDGALRMEMITAYNLVVDSNIETPAGKSPSAAHMGVKIYNDGPTALTNVVVNIGNMTAPGVGTPGLFASRTVNEVGQYAGTFQLAAPGGVSDCTRVIPRIEPGEYVAQYFFVTYPLLDSLNRSVTGAASVPEDDLWLNYDIWASANSGALKVDERTKVTMRNEISAMANKIWPNTGSKVPDEYLTAIQSTLGWRPEAGTTRIPGAVVMEGIWYDLGNVGAGFDNDGDLLPDRNAWMQPVGDPSKFSPLAARLVKCYGIVIVKLNDGTEQLIPFEDQLYFEKIAANNTGAVGLVYYEFIPLNLSLPALLSPYQEVASGYDNEKFNADYGASVGSVSGTPPLVAFDKNGPVSVAGGDTATYTLSATNNELSGSSKVFGWPELSLPLVFQDTVPTSLVYVAGSATSVFNTAPSGQTYTVYWSTNGGTSWVTTEPTPASVTTIRWIMSGSLARTQSAVVQFQATLPSNYAGAAVNNTACLKTGTEIDFACDTTTSRVTGINSLGDFVWRDLDRDGVQDGGLETGIADITVSLYYDTDGDGVLDAGEPLYGTTSTNASGIYGFSNLADGKYIVVVDQNDAQLPTGFTLPNSATTAIAVNLDPTNASATAVSVLTADWPFIPALEIVKSVTPTTYGAGELVNFTIDLENHSAPVAAQSNPVQTSWSTTVNSASNRAAVQLPANAQGVPNNASALLDWNQGSDRLTTSGGYVFPDQTGTITKVELLLYGYMSATMLDDRMDVVFGGTTVADFIPNATLNTWTGSSALRVVEIPTNVVAKNWATIQALTVELQAKSVGSKDNATMYMDSIGIRVTATASTPTSGTYGPTSITPLPLTDTFDNTKLAYVSASVAPTSVSGGTITWANLGPLNPGVRKTITVTFLTLTTASTITTTNTATATNAYFVSGRRTNDDTDDATITINPRGSIGDRVWWDKDADGVQDVGEPGLENVLVTLSNGAQTRTDANGNYLFPGLVSADYTVTVVTSTLPSGFTQTFDADGISPAAKANNSVVTIAGNDNVLQDFGYDSALNMITGSIFQDNDGDGIQDPGENFLAGVTVTLSGRATATTTTDANGFYSFSSLADVTGPLPTYTVTVTQPGSTIQTLDPDGAVKNNATNEAATGGNIYPDNDFAYQPSGALTLGDTLYYDWNGDGDQDAGEQGIPNVDVFLYEDTNGNGIIDVATDAYIGTSVTNASGVYGFSSLLAGNYLVIVNTADAQFPSSVTQIQDFDGVRDGKATVSLAASRSDVDFGYQPLGTGVIGNLIWLDADNDGIKDTSESGINGVTVQLYRSGQTPGVDTPYATTTTSGGGLYGFTNLPAESYTVYLPVSNFTGLGALVNTPLSSTTTVTADNAVDNDDNGSQSGGVATAVSSPVIVLSAAETDNTKDFGFLGVGSVGDFVFYDSNGNGSQDFSEAGIPSVTVKLFLDANADGVADTPLSPVATTTTSDGSGGNPVGSYRFSNLTPGTYFVQVDTATLPAGVTYTADPDRDGIPVGSLPALPAGDNADSLVIVTSGSNYSGADFGYKPPGAIGDFVWLDLDQDGVQDSGEPGIAGVIVEIRNASTDALLFTVVTDFDGYWSQILADGSYKVVIPTSNFNPGGPLENRATTYDADGIGTANIATITIASGLVTVPAALPQGNLGIDFGYKLNGSYGLSGTIAIHDTGLPGTADDVDDFYEDGVDMDAGAADEVELSGVEVFLFTSGGDLLGTTFTDANGDYAFTGLPSGSYNVIIGTTASPLDLSTLTTTTGNNLSGSTVSSTATSVTQLLTISTSSVVNVDFTFNSTVNYDFGDLPSSYSSTTLAHDGARHIIPGGGSTLYLGTAPDADTNGLPSSLANGDDSFGSDDENGVTPVSISTWANGVGGGSIQVSVTGSGWLVGWIDWNHDGDLLDTSEFIVSKAVSPGTQTISFAIPAGTIGATSESWLSRFRLFTTEPAFPLFSYEGAATNGEVEDHLFERPVAGSIGDFVWIDSDGNGAINGTETGLGGVVVELRDSGNVLLATQTTSNGSQDVDVDGVIDPVGYYRFRALSAATYNIVVPTTPTGYSVSYDKDNGITNPDGATQVILGTDVQYLEADFGYEPLLADISGTVYFDTIINSTIDAPGDATASFVRIQLFTDPNGDGNPSDGVQVRETYTNASGYYEFVDVPTGNYVVVEVNPPGVTSVFDVAGANDDRIPVVMVGSDITGRNFLDAAPTLYSVAGTVYDDSAANNNVINDGVDARVAGVTVNLYIDRDGNGLYAIGDTLWATTTTNSTGDYSFIGLYPGDYVVEKINPAGGSVTNDWDSKTPLNDSQIGVQIVAANIVDRDFLIDGYHGSISDFVWVDADADGQQDGGETGLDGVTVTLYRPNFGPDGIGGNGDDATAVATATTAGGGAYSFTGLPPGTYQVNFGDPLTHNRTSADQGNDSTDSDANALTGQTGNIVLGAGESNTSIDAGYILDTCPDDWAEWKAQHPTQVPYGNPGGNPDADNYDNFAEFAFHMPYDSGETGSHLPEGNAWIIRPTTLNPDILEGVFVRPTGAPDDVTYILQYADTLGNPMTWTEKVISSADVAITIVQNGDCTETVTINNLQTFTGITPEGFVRIKAVLDDPEVVGTVNHTSFTEAEGWTRTDYGLCCSSYNVPYQREAEFTGTVATVNGQALEFTGENFVNYLTSGASYYVEVTSGDNEGHRFDVISASGNAIALATDSALHSATAPFSTLTGALPSSLAGDKITLHRHWTLAALFPPLDHVATASQLTADQVQIFVAGAWKIYWLYDLDGAGSVPAIWVDAADVLMVDQAAVIIPPGQGMLFNNRGVVRTLLSYGEIRVNDFIRPLPIGRSFVGGGYPLDQSAAGARGRQMTKAVGFFGSRDFTTADSFFLWNADTISQGRSYSTYFFHDATPKSPALIRWVVVGDNVIQSRDAEVHFKSDRAVFIRTKNGLPTSELPTPLFPAYTIPSPWAP